MGGGGGGGVKVGETDKNPPVGKPRPRGTSLPESGWDGKWGGGEGSRWERQIRIHR